jgi:hypothetical protein
MSRPTFEFEVREYDPEAIPFEKKQYVQLLLCQRLWVYIIIIIIIIIIISYCSWVFTPWQQSYTSTDTTIQ